MLISLFSASQNFIFAKKEKKALIVFSGDEFQAGYNDSQKINTYLRHFDYKADLISESQYKADLMNGYDAVFYMGSQNNSINKDFINDSIETDKKLIWLNEGLERLPKGFLSSKGVSIAKETDCENIYYKNIILPKNDKKLNLLKVTDNKKNIIYASAILSKYKKSPYILNSKNFWYVADNPLNKAKEGSAYLAFADILHNVLDDHSQERIAVVRIDGINPKTSSEKLQTIVDFLYFSRIPFAISVTPVYKKSLKSEKVYLHDKQKLIKVLKDCQKKDGQIILNGYTHQLNGETGKDVEFWDFKREDRQIPDTENRVKLALAEMKKSGFKAIIWQTPYYMATDKDHQIFRNYFADVFERGTEPPSPYLIRENNYGQKVLPENLGYVAYEKTPQKETITERAWRMQVVRDAYVGFAIQDGISTESLVKIIRRMQGMGYSFRNPYGVIGVKYKKCKPPFFADSALYNVSLRTEYLMQNIGWMILPFVFISYYLVIFGLSKRIKPKKKKQLRNLFFVFIVPALNEEKVIYQTLKKLTSLPYKNYTVLAVNDNSKDKTLNEMGRIRSGKLRILTIHPLDCQKGKGNVLNWAYDYILNSDIVKAHSPEDIIVAVVDSDGSVDNEIIPSVSPYFESPKSASVQTAVRIENCDTNIWTKWQDFEFRVFTYLFQSAREQLGSVGLGGNGQFIRLAALRDLGERPWTDCLTEDLDVGIRLMLKGWRNHFCPTSYVNQQGIPEFWPLVKQRARWFQGHVQCWRHLGGIATSRLPIISKIDITYYLLSISLALVIVPANFLMAAQAGYLVANPSLLSFLSVIFGTRIFFYWYFIYFGAMPLFTYSYWRAKPQPLYKAIILSHLFLFVSVIWLIAGYLALFRLFRKTTGWDKTARFVRGPEPT